MEDSLIEIIRVSGSVEHTMFYPGEQEFETLNAEPFFACSHFKKEKNSYHGFFRFVCVVQGAKFKVKISNLSQYTIITNIGTMFDSIPNTNATSAVAFILANLFEGIREDVKLNVKNPLPLLESLPPYQLSEYRTFAKSLLLSGLQ